MKSIFLCMGLLISIFMLSGCIQDLEGDSDGDGVSNITDNCPEISNEDQLDSNNDGVGDACEEDERETQQEDAESDDASSKDDDSINGYNANLVMYTTGAFVQLNSKHWVENNGDGAHSFRELRRDEWSVYLRDFSRNIDIQLDLHRKEIIYTDSTQTFVLYDVISVSPERINGYAANRVHYSGGGFVQINLSDWVENIAGESYTYEEYARDEWSVYLKDEDGATVQLDMHTREVIFREGGDKTILAENIEPKPAKINGYTVREVLGELSDFVQTDFFDWVEHLETGHVNTYSEKYRDEWSVYLYDNTRDLHLQLDLHTQTMKQNIGSGFQTIYQLITEAN